MPSVLLIGGPLDGELREVPKGSLSLNAYTPAPLDDSPNVRPPPHTTYHIANGIARHESVSEEEVARRVHYCLLPVDVIESRQRIQKILDDGDKAIAPLIQRYMRPQFPMGE